MLKEYKMDTLEEIDKKLLESELAVLNKTVDKAIQKRSNFIKKNIKYFAEFKIGEKLYNCATGRIGVCVKYYRFHEDDFRYDRNLDCHCKIEEPIDSMVYQNT